MCFCALNSVNSIGVFKSFRKVYIYKLESHTYDARCSNRLVRARCRCTFSTQNSTRFLTLLEAAFKMFWNLSFSACVYHQPLNSNLRSLTGAEPDTDVFTALTAHYNQSHTMLFSL